MNDTTTTAPPRMFCFVCRKELRSAFGDQFAHEAHPSGAVCLQGAPPYGSRFDSDCGEVGFNGYEVFVCDDCWEPRRDVVLAYRERQPPPVREYITGTECQARIDALYQKLEPEEPVQWTVGGDSVCPNCGSVSLSGPERPCPFCTQEEPEEL